MVQITSFRWNPFRAHVRTATEGHPYSKLVPYPLYERPMAVNFQIIRYLEIQILSGHPGQI